MRKSICLAFLNRSAHLYYKRKRKAEWFLEFYPFGYPSSTKVIGRKIQFTNENLMHYQLSKQKATLLNKRREMIKPKVNRGDSLLKFSSVWLAPFLRLT